MLPESAVAGCAPVPVIPLGATQGTKAPRAVARRTAVRGPRRPPSRKDCVHLAGLVGSSVKVTLEIEATVEAGTPENVVRTVTENSRTLKFTTHGFEEE